MTENREPQKPEWFAMTEGDHASVPAETRTSKRMPLLALVATGAILTAGALFANANDEDSANAENLPAQIQASQSTADVQPPQQQSQDPQSPLGISKPSQVRPEHNEDDRFEDGDRPQWNDDEDDEGEEHHRFPDGDREHHGDRRGFNREGQTSNGATGGIPSTGTGN
jgi:hypothetical protein